jgi:hypothetical protein
MSAVAGASHKGLSSGWCGDAKRKGQSRRHFGVNTTEHVASLTDAAGHPRASLVGLLGRRAPQRA